MTDCHEYPLQAEDGCTLCAGCHGDTDFDYCRGCGYGRQAYREAKAKARSALQQAIDSARGGPAPGPTEGW